MRRRPTLLMLTLTCSVALAQDYTPSPEAVRSVDAHAVAFTGRHCNAGRFVAKAPKPASQEEFDMAAAVMDAAMRAAAKREPTVKLKSSTSDTLYRVFIATSKNKVSNTFMVMYRDQGQVYLYSCDLK